MNPEHLIGWLLRNQERVSARRLHRLLEIRQPYGLWLHRHVTGVSIHRAPDDFLFAQEDGVRDCWLSPVMAIIAATGGGSKLAAKVQVAYCRLLAGTVFKGRNPIEVIDTGIKCFEAERLLERSFEPE